MNAGYIFILSAALCWGFIGIFSGIAFAQGVSPLEVAFWRAVIAWLCFAALALTRRETRLDVKDAPLMLLFALFGVSLFYFVYLHTVQTGGAAFASVLLYTAPAWVILSLYVVHRKKPKMLQIFAVILVLLGVSLISGSGGNANAKTPFSAIAVLTGLASGFCYSLYYTMGKYFSGKYTSANLFFYVLPLGAAGLLPFVEFSHKTPLAWLAIILVSVLSTYIANWCYYKSLNYLEASTSSIVATMEPVIAAIAAFLFFGEYFTVSGYAGATSILLAVLLTINRETG